MRWTSFTSAQKRKAAERLTIGLKAYDFQTSDVVLSQDVQSNGPAESAHLPGSRKATCIACTKEPPVPQT
jgi:hypothetical protein